MTDVSPIARPPLGATGGHTEEAREALLGHRLWGPGESSGHLCPSAVSADPASPAAAAGRGGFLTDLSLVAGGEPVTEPWLPEGGLSAQPLLSVEEAPAPSRAQLWVTC